MSIPILGQKAFTIPAQLRLTISEKVGKTLDETKGLGLLHGRLILHTPLDSNSIELMLYLDGLHTAGCAIVALTEHIGQTPQGPVLQAHIVFRLPRELAQ